MQNELPFELESTSPELAPPPSPDGLDEAEITVPFDSARFLAWHMLQAAMDKPDKPLSPGLYILQGPNEEWSVPLGNAMHDIYLGSKPHGRKRRMVGSGRPKLHLLEVSSKTDSRQARVVTDEVQNILVNNEVAVVIAGSDTVIPPALRCASDRIFVIPAPRRQWVARLIREIAPGGRRLDFSVLNCEAITPTMLRLAYRRNMTATAFIVRLMNLTAPIRHTGGGKTVALDHLHGVDEAKRWASDLKTDLARYRAGELPWSALSRGLLLSGKPGTAKTTLPEAIAQSCGLTFIPSSYAAWQRRGSGHLGDVLKAMAETFADARARKPALVFIDELDSLGSRGQDTKRDDWWRSIINALLPEMDGTEDNEGIILMAATNHPELIDPAILRAGRLEERITLRLPDVEALALIYRDQLEAESDNGVNFRHIATLSAGMTGADVIKTCNTARRRARNASRRVTDQDLLTAISGSQFNLDSERLWRVGVHEAGHAIVALSFPQLYLEHVTIIGRGDAGGGTATGMRNDRPVTQAMFEACITCALGGRAAEQVLLGEVSAGAGGRDGSDLSRATQLAADAELSLGLHQHGLIWYAPQSAKELAKLFSLRPDIERAVRARLDHAYAMAVELIKAKAPLVRRLAERLLIAKVMSGEEVAALIQNASYVEKASAGGQPAPNNGWLH